MRKCTNCAWKGQDEETKNGLMHCPVCGDNTIKVEADKKEEVVDDFDLDGDGDVDSDDRKKAARLLGSKRGKSKKRKYK